MFLLFSEPEILSSPLAFSLPPMSVVVVLIVTAVSQSRGRTAGSYPPLPLVRSVGYIFIARRLQPHLPSSTSVELLLSHASRALSAVDIFDLSFANTFTISPRWDSNFNIFQRLQHSRVTGMPTGATGYILDGVFCFSSFG